MFLSLLCNTFKQLQLHKLLGFILAYFPMKTVYCSVRPKEGKLRIKPSRGKIALLTGLNQYFWNVKQVYNRKRDKEDSNSRNYKRTYLTSKISENTASCPCARLTYRQRIACFACFVVPVTANCLQMGINSRIRSPNSSPAATTKKIMTSILKKKLRLPGIKLVLKLDLWHVPPQKK